jgi:hypothetical protein
MEFWFVNQTYLEFQIKRKGNYVHKHNTYTLPVGNLSTERFGNIL